MRDHEATKQILNDTHMRHQLDKDSLRLKMESVIEVFSREKQSLVSEQNESVRLHLSEIKKLNEEKEVSLQELQNCHDQKINEVVLRCTNSENLVDELQRELESLK